MTQYKVKSFDRFARKNRISDADLATAATEVLEGSYDADLGGGVYKQRVARKGEGKSGGFRTLITHKTSEHVFFVYGFGKNVRDNIDEKELKALKLMAKEFGKLSQAQVDEAVASGEFVEVEDDED
jgi:hypothetical protein